jgi:hypothetical protein
MFMKYISINFLYFLNKNKFLLLKEYIKYNNFLSTFNVQFLFC